MAWYAKFDGVDGSALHKDHKAWCSAASVNMSGKNVGGEGIGVGRVGGKMHLEDIKKVEIHSTARSSNDSEQVYLGIELENVQITSYQLSVLDNKAATDHLSIVLNFEKYEFVFTS